MRRGGLLVALFALLACGPAAATGSWGGDIPATRQAGTRSPAALQTQSATGSAADSVPDDLDTRVKAIASRLRCPECRAQSVAESNSRISRAMREEIRDRLLAGETPEQIEAFFLESYGDFILLQPRARGLNLLVYALPVVAFLVGLTVFALVLRRRNDAYAVGGGSREGPRPTAGQEARTAREDADPTAGDPLAPEDREWLERAIRGERPPPRG